jgi:tetratricopeptide (TPR) repeat protein
LIQQGDSPAAEISARRALEVDDQSPEAYNLLGYVAALQGDFEGAIEHYRRAIALDETYLEAMLNAAEVYVHPLGEYDEALRMCDTAFELVETEEELVDTLLLRFDALLGKNEVEQARAVCARFPKGPFENKNHAFLVGRAFYEIGDAQAALPLIEDSIKANPTHADASYYLGLIREETGDGPGATAAFLRTRELDLEVLPPSWSLSRQTFELTVRRVVSTLATELRLFLREDEVYLGDTPGVEVVVDGVDPRALLLLDGGAPDSHHDFGGGPTRARLFVYQRNVERVAGRMEMVEDELRAALEREIREHFIEGGIEAIPLQDAYKLN